MNTPTKLTISRIVLTVAMLIALFVLWIIGICDENFVTPTIGNSGINVVFLVACIVFIIASFTDFLDGYLARKNNQVTTLGKFLDPVADKLLVNSLMIFAAFPTYFAPYASQNVTFIGWCAIVCILRDIVVDALRFIAAQQGTVIAANIFGKAKTVAEMIAIPLVLLNGWPFNYFDASWPIHISDIFVIIATLLSFISGAIYVIKYRSVFLPKKEAKGDK